MAALSQASSVLIQGPGSNEYIVFVTVCEIFPPRRHPTVRLSRRAATVKAKKEQKTQNITDG